MIFSLSRRTLYFQDGSPKLLLTDVNGVSCCLERWLNLLQWFFSHLPPHLLYITIRRNFEPRPTRPHSAGRWVINCPPAFDDSPYISRCIAPAKRQQSKRVHMVGPGNMSPVLVGCYEAKGVLWHLKIQHRTLWNIDIYFQDSLYQRVVIKMQVPERRFIISTSFHKFQMLYLSFYHFKSDDLLFVCK